MRRLGSDLLASLLRLNFRFSERILYLLGDDEKQTKAGGNARVKGMEGEQKEERQ